MKTLSLTFHDETISLKNTDENTIVCQDLDNIFMAIRQLHKIYLREIKVTNFKPATEKFLSHLINKYTNNRIDLNKKNYNSFYKNLLKGITDHIYFIVNTSNEKLNDYSYNITIINFDINVEKHTITILIKNIETGEFLEAVIFLREHFILSKNDQFSIEIIVATRLGMIRFESVD